MADVKNVIYGVAHTDTFYTSLHAFPKSVVISTRSRGNRGRNPRIVARYSELFLTRVNPLKKEVHNNSV